MRSYAFAMTEPALLMACSTNVGRSPFGAILHRGEWQWFWLSIPFSGYINFYVPCPPPVDNRCGFQ
jgi:hypothetical protein